MKSNTFLTIDIRLQGSVNVSLENGAADEQIRCFHHRRKIRVLKFSSFDKATRSKEKRVA